MNLPNKQYQISCGSFDYYGISVDKRLRDRDFDTEGVKLILGDYPKRVRKIVYQYARYFRREFRYDFVQYSNPDSPELSTHCKAFLFHEPRYSKLTTAFGACCFRYRDGYKDMHPFWALQWIWIHPYERRQGYLKKAWPHFKKLFGDFLVEPPFSPAMSNFLKSSGYDHGEIFKSKLKG